MILEIWDSPGIDHFSNANTDDFYNTDACILVYAIDKEGSFDEIAELHEKISNKCKSTMFFLVGNKSDLDKKGQR